MNAETRLQVEDTDLRRGHAFFPPDSELNAMPKLYSTESVLTRDKLVHLHYFVGGFDWWIVEVDPDSLIAFGFACLNDPVNAEWGNIDLVELALLYRRGEMMRKEMNGTTALVARPPIIVERDLYWQVRPAGEVEGIKIPGGGA